jgi:hypothetical protein
MGSKLITDGLLLKGFQCKKRYWLEQHRPELKRSDLSGMEWKAMVKTEVETEAVKFFEGASRIKGRTLKAAAKATRKAIEKQEPMILDGVFIHDGIVCRIDAMAREDTGYSLYEIKSSAGIKDVYFNEAAIKWAILTLCKVPLVRSYILHINNKYVRDGALDVHRLFNQKNITQVVRRRQEAAIKTIDDLLSIKKDKPHIHIGAWCNDPYECDFRQHCWRNIPTPSVFDLHKLPGNKKFELYRQGIVRFEDLAGNIDLSPHQRHQVEAELEGKDFIDIAALKTFLNEIRYPVYFLDFETFQQAVPRFDKLRPYEQIPFQFSLHVVDNEGAEVKHVEFLAEAGCDPRRELAERLVAVMGNEGTILAYNQAFEKGVIRKLAESFPDLADALEAMRGRFVDLMYPFEKGLYYTKNMNGRHSIKTVLPALVPELTYQGMEIGHGGEAMNAYATLHLVKDDALRHTVRQNLLEYCKLDTLAMVRIWDKLKKSANKQTN